MTTTRVAVRHRAYLYDETGRLPVRGVLARPSNSGPDLAAFAPWPASLGAGVPFTVGIHPHRTSGDAWPGVAGVDVFDISGAGSSRDFGVVQLVRRLSFSPGIPAQLVSRAQLENAFAQHPGDVGAVLARLGDDVFGGLTGTTAPAVDSPDTAPAAQLTASVPFTLESGSSDAMAGFICRIFRWD